MEEITSNCSSYFSQQPGLGSDRVDAEFENYKKEKQQLNSEINAINKSKEPLEKKVGTINKVISKEEIDLSIVKKKFGAPEDGIDVFYKNQFGKNYNNSVTSLIKNSDADSNIPIIDKKIVSQIVKNELPNDNENGSIDFENIGNEIVADFVENHDIDSLGKEKTFEPIKNAINGSPADFIDAVEDSFVNFINCNNKMDLINLKMSFVQHLLDHTAAMSTEQQKDVLKLLQSKEVKDFIVSQDLSSDEPSVQFLLPQIIHEYSDFLQNNMKIDESLNTLINMSSGIVQPEELMPVLIKLSASLSKKLQGYGHTWENMSDGSINKSSNIHTLTYNFLKSKLDSLDSNALIKFYDNILANNTLAKSIVALSSEAANILKNDFQGREDLLVSAVDGYGIENVGLGIIGAFKYALKPDDRIFNEPIVKARPGIKKLSYESILISLDKDLIPHKPLLKKARELIQENTKNYNQNVKQYTDILFANLSKENISAENICGAVNLLLSQIESGQNFDNFDKFTAPYLKDLYKEYFKDKEIDGKTIVNSLITLDMLESNPHLLASKNGAQIKAHLRLIIQAMMQKNLTEIAKTNVKLQSGDNENTKLIVLLRESLGTHNKELEILQHLIGDDYSKILDHNDRKELFNELRYNILEDVIQNSSLRPILEGDADFEKNDTLVMGFIKNICNLLHNDSDNSKIAIKCHEIFAKYVNTLNPVQQKKLLLNLSSEQAKNFWDHQQNRAGAISKGDRSAVVMQNMVRYLEAELDNKSTIDELVLYSDSYNSQKNYIRDYFTGMGYTITKFAKSIEKLANIESLGQKPQPKAIIELARNEFSALLAKMGQDEIKNLQNLFKDENFGLVFDTIKNEFHRLHGKDNADFVSSDVDYLQHSVEGIFKALQKKAIEVGTSPIENIKMERSQFTKISGENEETLQQTIREIIKNAETEQANKLNRQLELVCNRFSKTPISVDNDKDVNEMTDALQQLFDHYKSMTNHELAILFKDYFNKLQDDGQKKAINVQSETLLKIINENYSWVKVENPQQLISDMLNADDSKVFLENLVKVEGQTEAPNVDKLLDFMTEARKAIYFAQNDAVSTQTNILKNIAKLLHANKVSTPLMEKDFILLGRTIVTKMFDKNLLSINKNSRLDKEKAANFVKIFNGAFTSENNTLAYFCQELFVSNHDFALQFNSILTGPDGTEIFNILKANSDQKVGEGVKLISELVMDTKKMVLFDLCSNEIVHTAEPTFLDKLANFFKNLWRVINGEDWLDSDFAKVLDKVGEYAKEHGQDLFEFAYYNANSIMEDAKEHGQDLFEFAYYNANSIMEDALVTKLKNERHYDDEKAQNMATEIHSALKKGAISWAANQWGLHYDPEHQLDDDYDDDKKIIDIISKPFSEFVNSNPKFRGMTCEQYFYMLEDLAFELKNRGTDFYDVFDAKVDQYEKIVNAMNTGAVVINARQEDKTLPDFADTFITQLMTAVYDPKKFNAAVKTLIANFKNGDDDILPLLSSTLSFKSKEGKSLLEDFMKSERYTRLCDQICETEHAGRRFFIDFDKLVHEK